MAKYRENIKQLFDSNIFMSDSGLETTLVFLEGVDLPCFASFPLLGTPEGRQRIKQFYLIHSELALQHRVPFILESVGRRANPDWAVKLGMSLDHLDHLNNESIRLLHEVREEKESPTTKMVISGVVGPRSDAYKHSFQMTAEEAKSYHHRQIQLYAASNVDLVTAYTLTYPEEGVGLALAAKEENLPVVLSFTLETDGKLPNGQTLAEVVELIDQVTGAWPLHYGVNCAHPDHFANMFRQNKDQVWLQRVRALRCNGSRKSHAELDNSTTLDSGDPEEFGRLNKQMLVEFPQIKLVAGCCGTDIRHIEQIGKQCIA